jgi:hypothetical protein
MKDNIILQLTAQCGDSFHQRDNLLINNQEYPWLISGNDSKVVVFFHKRNYTHPDLSNIEDSPTQMIKNKTVKVV